MGCPFLVWDLGKDGRSEILAFPDGEGRMGWGTKGPKQIRTELFSLFLVKLPPTEGRIAFYLAPAGEDLLHKNKPQF